MLRQKQEYTEERIVFIGRKMHLYVGRRGINELCIKR